MKNSFVLNMRSLLLGLGFFSFFFPGCTHQIPPAEQARQDDILLIGSGGDFSRLDPQIAYHAYDRRVQMALFEPLVVVDPDQNPVPALAESWSVTPDCKTYQFVLRQNASWSDGTPLKATDCVFSFQRLLAPRLGTPLSWFAYKIRGAKAFASGEVNDPSIIGVRAITDHILEIELEQPCCNFLQVLTYMAFSPLPEAHIRACGEWDMRTNDWDKLEHIVCNGPFRPKGGKAGQFCELELNPHYWDAENVQLKGIVFKFIGDTRTEERAFQADELHITYGLPSHRLAYYANHGDPREKQCLQVHFDFAAPELIVLNTKDPALKDSRVRRALNLAIDRVKLAELFLDGRKPAAGFVPPGIEGYTTPLGLLDLNVLKARELLAEAGYPDGLGFPKILYSYSATLPYKPVAEAIQAMLKEHLGIDLELLQVDAKTNFAKMMQGDFQLGRIVWRVECGEVGTLLAFFQSDNPANVTGWHSEEFDECLRLGGGSTDLQQAEAYFQRAETILIEESPILPLVYQPLIYLKKNYISNWTICGSAYIPYKCVSIQKP